MTPLEEFQQMVQQRAKPVQQAEVIVQQLTTTLTAAEQALVDSRRKLMDEISQSLYGDGILKNTLSRLSPEELQGLTDLQRAALQHALGR